MAPSRVWADGAAELWVGGEADAAADHPHFDLVVNCMHRESGYQPGADHFWLNIGWKGGGWMRRMWRCMELVLKHVHEDGVILFHCRQGLHRSVAALVAAMVLIGWLPEDAYDLVAQQRHGYRTL